MDWLASYVKLHAVDALVALGMLLAGWALGGFLGARAGAALQRARFEPTLARFLAGLLRWAIVLTAGVSALGRLGVQTASFAALLGAAGLAIALAFQGTLSSFAAGVLLVIFRPFKVGDTIKVGPQQGVVDAIDLFTTTIDTTDNRRVILPNSAVFGQTIENLSYHGRRVVELTVPVPITLDVEDARRALEEAVRGVPERLADGALEVHAVEAQAAQVVFRVRFWASTERLSLATDGAVRAIRRALDAVPKRA